MTRRFNPPLAVAIVACLTLLAGCGKARQAQKPPAETGKPSEAPEASGGPKEEKDERSRWVYENGWFVKGNGTAWFEHNEEATRLRGKPWEFTETKRTKEYVQMHDARRGVSVRLAEPASEAKWDRDGDKGEWRPLYKGRWVKLE